MDIYENFYRAYKVYNEELFDGRLGDIIITFVRKPYVKGYYSFSRFEYADEKGKKVSEISINPDYFGKGSAEEILSTLVHEMCHMYHDLTGKKCTDGYHSKKWAKIMTDRGLVPSSTGKEGGKMTGFLMGHYIQSGGLFEKVTQRIMEEGFTTGIIDVFSVTGVEGESEVGARKKGNGIRYKYSCGCSNVWGKKGLDIVCSRCGQSFIMKQ